MEHDTRIPMIDAIYETHIPNLDIAPSHIRLAMIERQVQIEDQYRLKDSLESVTEYEFAIIEFLAWQQGLLANALKTTDRIILYESEPIGRLVVIRSSSEICLADIALLPNHRGCGIGATLIRELQTEAAAGDLPLRLHVERDNRAARLYHRLGFAVVGNTGFHFKMEWLPR